MSRGHRHARVEMGEAIGFEDVLTVLTVLLLLRMIFMVPLVNLDKAKTVKSHGDEYWDHQAIFVLSHPADTSRVKPYRTAFALDGKAAQYTESGVGKSVYVEAATSDNDLTVLRHNLDNGNFIAMTVQGKGHSVRYRRGKLIWSQDEREWFPASDSVDYGTRADSKSMEKEFRDWTKAKRGY